MTDIYSLTSTLGAIVFGLDGVLLNGSQRVSEGALALVRESRIRGLKLAVVSPDLDARARLSAVGMAELFDAVLDGTDLAAMGLPPEPDPALFLAAAASIDVATAHAAVIEHDPLGVEAGAQAGFQLVIGVNAEDQRADLLEHGAHQIISDLSSLLAAEIKELPWALDMFESGDSDQSIRNWVGKRFVVFLDYDGTLTPIVNHPDEAVLSAEMRENLVELAGRLPVAIISGRDVENVRSLAAIDGITYAGSHGLDVIDASGTRRTEAGAEAYLVALDSAETELLAAVPGVQGAWVERKQFAIAVHYRQTPDTEVGKLDTIVDQAARSHPGLRRTSGKRVFELRPDISWDKGKAVLHLFGVLDRDQSAIAMYIGDDLTDEDAFLALRGLGAGVVVEGGTHRTYAEYRVSDVDAVRKLLDQLGR